MLAATAQIEPLAWESPYDTGVALKSKKKKRKTVRSTIDFSLRAIKAKDNEILSLSC